MRWHRVLCLALLPGTVAAQEIDYGSIDGFYVPRATLRWNGAPPAVDDDGNGFGLRVLSRATDTVMVLAEYDQLDYDGAGGSAAQYRVGAGVALPSTTGAYLTYDYLDLERENAIAFGLHGRLAGRVAPPLTLYGSAGYVLARGSSFYQDGFEFTAGVAYDLPEPWGLFADYRATLLDDRDSVEKLHREELRVGVRFRFDC